MPLNPQIDAKVICGHVGISSTFTLNDVLNSQIHWKKINDTYSAQILDIEERGFQL